MFRQTYHRSFASGWFNRSAESGEMEDWDDAEDASPGSKIVIEGALTSKGGSVNAHLFGKPGRRRKDSPCEQPRKESGSRDFPELMRAAGALMLVLLLIGCGDRGKAVSDH